MSRSCQRALFSKPTAAYPRKRRAIPQRRSERIGFRLCGIAEEPFWPRPKARRLPDPPCAGRPGSPALSSRRWNRG